MSVCEAIEVMCEVSCWEVRHTGGVVGVPSGLSDVCGRWVDSRSDVVLVTVVTSMSRSGRIR